jgi:hypothetical protein
MKNPFRSTRIFLGEMVGELQKCTWPTKTELRDSTIVVVVAAGNTADDGFHGHRSLGANGTANLTFKVIPGDRFRLFGALWYGGTGNPASGPGVDARIRLTLTAPDGASRSGAMPRSTMSTIC